MFKVKLELWMTGLLVLFVRSHALHNFCVTYARAGMGGWQDLFLENRSFCVFLDEKFHAERSTYSTEEYEMSDPLQVIK